MPETTTLFPGIMFLSNCGKKGRFKVVKKYLVDTQRIMLEEAPEDLEGGEQPEHINVVLKKDLVDPKFERNIIPGNKVVVSGIINESAIYYPSGKRSNTSDTFILASYVEAVEQGYEDIVVTKEEEMAIKELANDKMIYTKFKNSIAPNIFGHDDIKEAIVMQLFGGVRKAALSGNSVIRGDIHILLVGDPGCLRADERIVLGNGAIIKIGNAGKTHLEEIKQDVLIGQFTFPIICKPCFSKLCYRARYPRYSPYVIPILYFIQPLPFSADFFSKHNLLSCYWI